MMQRGGCKGSEHREEGMDALFREDGWAPMELTTITAPASWNIILQKPSFGGGNLLSHQNYTLMGKLSLGPFLLWVEDSMGERDCGANYELMLGLSDSEPPPERVHPPTTQKREPVLSRIK